MTEFSFFLVTEVHKFCRIDKSNDCLKVQTSIKTKGSKTKGEEKTF